MPRPRKISAAVRKALSQGPQLPQAAELVSHFVAAIGGLECMAKAMLEEYLAAKPGSIIRQRILDTILRLTSKANEDLGVMDDLDMVSTDDLVRELQRLSEKLPDAAAEKD